jgi:hypothetical protein
MTFRFKPKKIGCLQLFVSSLATLIFIHYLAIGFIDVVLSVNNLLEWLQKNDIVYNVHKILTGK